MSSASGSRGSYICDISGVWKSWERSDRAESLFFLCKAAQCIVWADGQGWVVLRCVKLVGEVVLVVDAVLK